jgi:hypothetical protein
MVQTAEAVFAINEAENIAHTPPDACIHICTLNFLVLSS